MTIQNLIGSGMDPKTVNDPYLGFIYTSFQERATKISHGNTASHAAKHGTPQGGPACSPATLGFQMHAAWVSHNIPPSTLQSVKRWYRSLQAHIADFPGVQALQSLPPSYMPVGSGACAYQHVTLQLHHGLASQPLNSTTVLILHAGDKYLGKIMAAIAGDEARHEKAYIKIVDEFFRLCAPALCTHLHPASTSLVLYSRNAHISMLSMPLGTPTVCLLAQLLTM